MKAFITGGAGFVGSHLAEALLARGDEVFVLDDLSTGAIENIEGLKPNPRFHYVIDSIFNEPLTAELVDKADVVFHLAAAVGVRLIVESPVRTLSTNIGGSEIVMKNAAKKGKKVLIASTSEVYGKGMKVPFAEDDDIVLGPTSKGRWSYAASKMVDEFLALSYWKEKRMPCVVARLFNTVGPRQVGRYGMVVPRFVEQALRGGPITVYGDGEQSRCFGCVTDVVGGLIELIRSPKTNGQVYNIGNDEEITINGLAEHVRAKVATDTGRPPVAVTHVPYDQAYEAGFEDMRRRVPDLRKIREAVGYRPTVGVDAILERVIAHMRPRLAAEAVRTEVS